MEEVSRDMQGVKWCIIPRASRFIQVFISFRWHCPVGPRSGVTDARDNRFATV